MSEIGSVTLSMCVLPDQIVYGMYVVQMEQKCIAHFFLMFSLCFSPRFTWFELSYGKLNVRYDFMDKYMYFIVCL